jgi:hypothetical protein
VSFQASNWVIDGANYSTQPNAYVRPSLRPYRITVKAAGQSHHPGGRHDPVDGSARGEQLVRALANRR